MKDCSKDPKFIKADELAVSVYRDSESIPHEGGARMGGLREQLREHAFSVPMFLMRGAQETQGRRRDRSEFVDMAQEEAISARYLVSVAGRLGLYPKYEETIERYTKLIVELDE